MYEAKIILDSSDGKGSRLTTMAVTLPRIMLSELNTHRGFCLTGDSILEFDLPMGTSRNRNHRRIFSMRIDDFVDKWLYGARRYKAKPKLAYDLSWVDPGREYLLEDAAERMGMKSYANLNTAARSGALRAYKKDGNKAWWALGKDLITYRQQIPEHTRFDIRARLAGMRIRQLNEETGDIQWSHVKDVCVSGEKEVFEVIAGDYTVSGSRDHLVMTSDGWKPIGDLTTADRLLVRKFGKKIDDRVDPQRLTKINGKWRSQWQRRQREILSEQDPLCRRCKQAAAEDVHHIIPVYQDPSRALDETNITFLCQPCHRDMHAKQGWQDTGYLYAGEAPVEEIRSRGIEQTYDLEIEGKYPNFLANGVVVHNSRNSASSRAIPVNKRILSVLENPFIPQAFGSNKAGMQPGGPLDAMEQGKAKAVWMDALNDAVGHARRLSELGVHKQWANRLIEPFSWTTVLITSSEWENFFNLRINPEAQDEIRYAATLMQEAMGASTPNLMYEGEWHFPYLTKEDAHLSTHDKIKVCVARCARVSYLTHEGVRDIDKDIELYDRLLSSGHMSPLEHVAIYDEYCSKKFPSNFRAPWYQHRKQVPGEAIFNGGKNE